MSKIPEEWSYLGLKEALDIKKGKKPKVLTENNDDSLYPYVDIKAFEKGIVRKYAAREDGVFASKVDSLMVWDGARSGLVGNGIEGVIGSTLAKINSDYNLSLIHI